MYGFSGFRWDVHLFSDPAVVVADQILIVEVDIGAGAENVGAFNMIVEVSDEVLSGC